MMLDQLNLKVNTELRAASKPTTAGSLLVSVEIQEMLSIQRKEKLNKMEECFIPSRASRFTHPGMHLPVNLHDMSSVKWLQFLEIRW